MSGITLPNTSCGRCHVSASTLGKPFLECAACRSVLYCSKPCQKQDWKNHKPQCRQLQAGEQPTRQRTTMGINLGDFISLRGGAGGPSSSAQDISNTIYYIKTSTPHLHDVSVSGPYKSLDAVYQQVKHNFGADCQPGKDALEDFVVDGHLMGFEHISSPINGDPNRIRRIQLVRKANADVAPRLPCPVWNILVAEVATEALSTFQPGSSDSAPVRDATIRDSYLSEAAANEAVQAVLQGLDRNMPGREISR